MVQSAAWCVRWSADCIVSMRIYAIRFCYENLIGNYITMLQEIIYK